MDDKHFEKAEHETPLGTFNVSNAEICFLARVFAGATPTEAAREEGIRTGAHVVLKRKDVRRFAVAAHEHFGRAFGLGK